MNSILVQIVKYICYPHPSLNQFARRCNISLDQMVQLRKKKREREREKPGYNVKIELFPFGAIDALVPLFKPL